MPTPTFEKFFRSDDDELLRLTARGNDQSYAELMRRYMRAVFEYTSRFVDPETAEKLVAETFYSFWKGLGRLQSRKKFRRKLFTFAHRAVLAYYGEKYGKNSKALGTIRHLRSLTLLQLADSVRKWITNKHELANYYNRTS